LTCLSFRPSYTPCIFFISHCRAIKKKKDLFIFLNGKKDRYRTEHAKEFELRIMIKDEVTSGDIIKVYICDRTAKMHGIVNNRMHATRLDERIIRQSNTALLHASPFFLLPFSSYSVPSLTPQIEKENEKSDNLLLLLSAPKNAEDVLICIVYHTTVKNTIIAMYIFSSIIYF